MTMDKTIDAIWRSLSKLFRHMLPGLTIIMLAAVAHPRWFDTFNPSDKWHLVIIATISIIVGNVWYVVHRLTLHNVLDYVCLIIREKTSDKEKKSYGFLSYLKWLSEFVDRGVRLRSVSRKLADHIWTRSSYVIFLFIICEAAWLFIFYHEHGTVFENYRCKLIIADAILSFFALVQYFISSFIDTSAVDFHVPTRQN